MLTSLLLATSTPATPPTDAIWYGLLRYYIFFGVAAGVIVIGFMVWTTFHNRASRRGARAAERQYAYHPREHNWGNWKMILPLVLITVSVQAFVEYQTFASNGLYVPPTSGDPITIGVVGRQWDWVFVYPDGVQVVGNLTVPQNELIILNITSTDVFHSFTIPALSVARDAIPGHYNTLWFNATQTGSYLILCKELCGVGHALMLAHLSVISQSAYQTWYSSLGGNRTSP